jgi:hypothetical protein
MVVAVVAHPAEAIEKEEDTGKFFHFIQRYFLIHFKFVNFY